MKTFTIRLALAIAVCSTFGCAMCCGPFDYDYPTFGGKHERVDRSYGRVGSLFSDPVANPQGDSADSNLKPAEKRERRDSSGDSDEADRIKERLELELDDSDPKTPNQRKPAEEGRPNPDTKEAFNQLQRPSSLKQWR